MSNFYDVLCNLHRKPIFFQKVRKKNLKNLILNSEIPSINIWYFNFGRYLEERE